MFILALCLVGTALALPAIPPAPILPLEGNVIISDPGVLMTYGATPEFAPLRTLEFRVEPIPKEETVEEYKEEKEEIELEKNEELEFEKKDEEMGVEEETKKDEEPKKEEEPTKPELKPESVFIQLDVQKPPSVISNWFSYLPFTLPSSITNWFSRGERLPLPTRVLYPGAARYVILGEAKP